MSRIILRLFDVSGPGQGTALARSGVTTKPRFY